MADKKPKEVWGCFINMGGGLHFKTPKRFKWHSQLESWWYDDDYEVKELGLNSNDDYGYATFASTNKKEVETFISGVTTFIEVCLRRYTDDG